MKIAGWIFLGIVGILLLGSLGPKDPHYMSEDQRRLCAMAAASADSKSLEKTYCDPAKSAAIIDATKQ